MWQAGLLLLQFAVTVLNILKDRAATTQAQKAAYADLLQGALDDLKTARAVSDAVDALPADKLRSDPANLYRD